MRARELAIAGVVLLAIGFVLGRYSASGPRIDERSKVVEETRQIATERVGEVGSEATAIARTVIVETRPDGTRIETQRDEAIRVEVREVEVVRTVQVEVERVVERERVVAAAQPNWRVAVDLGLADAPHRLDVPGVPRYLPAVANLAAERRIAGPVWVGVWASSTPAVGIRVAVEF